MFGHPGQKTTSSFKTKIWLGKWDTENSLEKRDKHCSSNLGQKTRPNHSLQVENNPSDSGRRCSSRPQNENNKAEKPDKYLNLAWELNNVVEYEGDGYTSCSFQTLR